VPAVCVVIATRNRRASLLRTLERVSALPERPRVVVVDNASDDGTADAVRAAHPAVEVIALARNVGAAARNWGVARARVPYVAFSDDDSWWAPGALGLAGRRLDARPRLAVVAARVLVGPEERLDPTCAQMAASPVPAAPGLPGPAVLGFLACGAVVRRSAFLGVGGFAPWMGIGGEEAFLALDLAAAGWELTYLPDVVAHHHPPRRLDPDARRRAEVRNALWLAWLRRRPRGALSRTASLAAETLGDRAAAAGLVDALLRLPWALAERRAVPADVEAAVRLLDALAASP